MRATIAKPFEVMELSRHHGQLKVGLDSISGLGIEGGEGSVGINLLVGVHHLVVGSLELIQVSCNSSVIELGGGILHHGIGGGWGQWEAQPANLAMVEQAVQNDWGWHRLQQWRGC